MAQQVTLTTDKFFEIKQLLKSLHYDQNRRFKSKPSSANHRYIRQRKSRIARQELMRSDPRFYEFFNWIFDLQKRTLEAGLIKHKFQFAGLIGTTPQTLKHWRNFNKGCGGHFPSDKAFRKLMRIEVMLQAKVETTHSKANVKTKKFPRSRIGIPTLKGRRRLAA